MTDGIRKLTAFGLVVVAMVVLTALDRLTPEAVNTLTWALGLFVGGNAAEHLARTVTARTAPTNVVNNAAPTNTEEMRRHFGSTEVSAEVTTEGERPALSGPGTREMREQNR